MSQISDACAFEEEESEYADSESSHHTASSLSRCNSSCSIANSTRETEKSREASTSLETVWTDSKHSSYLDQMEANFVKNLYGRSYCVQDVCGQNSELDLHHENQCTEIDECDGDSAQSRLQMPSETMEFKMYNHGDWTWRPVSRSMVPAGIPWVLLKNPWVKHFRTKKSSAISSTISSASPSLAKDAVGSVSKTPSTCNSNTVPSTLLSSREDQAGRVDVVNRATLSTNIIGQVEHPQEVNTARENGSSSNPGISNTKKRALWSTCKQVPVSRQNTGNEVKGGCGNSTFNQDDAAPLNVILDLASESLCKLVEES